ncbi:hypothetical protein CcCBS67573_g02566 [Chytriomyces confervae]|uniref:CID domain-containing protein n=1 Tax=Chytriomyces confervae TaxID=246404 RepID=A0A507FIM6_9FUNG|nr:hypothetical protein CcCBS67573_g02566 [Chytriomyces confervae]
MESEFDREVLAVVSASAPLSASRIERITRLAVKYAKNYKAIVFSVERLVTKCGPEHKLSGLYIIDSVVRACHKTLQPTDYANLVTRFEEKIEHMFPHMLSAPPKDKEKMKKLLQIWKGMQLFSADMLEGIEMLYLPDSAPSNQSISGLQGHGSPIHASSSPIEPSMPAPIIKNDPRRKSSALGNFSVSATSDSLSTEPVVQVQPSVIPAPAPPQQQIDPLTALGIDPSTMDPITLLNTMTMAGQLGVDATLLVPPLIQSIDSARNAGNTAVLLQVWSVLGDAGCSALGLNMGDTSKFAALVAATAGATAAASNASATHQPQQPQPVKPVSDFDYGDEDEDDLVRPSLERPTATAASAVGSISGGPSFAASATASPSVPGPSKPNDPHASSFQTLQQPMISSDRLQANFQNHTTTSSSATIVEKQHNSYADTSHHQQQYPPPVSLTTTHVQHSWAPFRPKTIWGGRNPEKYIPELVAKGPSNFQPFQDPTAGGNANVLRILSRTLFVGGLRPETSVETLRAAFIQHANVRVAGANINPNKLTGFVKTYTREEAVQAREIMNQVPVDGTLLRVSWGCGFGPKEHFKYETGETAFPVNEMSEADKKAIGQARYGGGRPIQGGLIIEEPDISDEVYDGAGAGSGSSFGSAGRGRGGFHRGRGGSSGDVDRRYGDRKGGRRSDDDEHDDRRSSSRRSDGDGGYRDRDDREKKRSRWG